jgi:hypothetical protein
MDRFGEKSIFWSKNFFRDFWSKMTPGDPKKSKNIETTRKTSPDIIFGPIGTSFDDFEKCDFLYYPYLDTFKFFNKNKNRFSNSDRFNWDYKLVQSDGSLERDREEDVELEFEEDWDDDF